MASFCITFKIINDEYSGYGILPSPGKVLGALLHSAYIMEDSSAINEVRKLASIPVQPHISISSPYLSVCDVTSYSANNVMSESQATKTILNNKVSFPDLSGGKVEEKRHTVKYPQGTTFSYWVDGDSNINRNIIDRVCSQIHFIGKGHDFCISYTEDKLPEGITFSFVGKANKENSLSFRMWSQSLLEYYDEKYERTYISKNRSYTDPSQIEIGQWRRVKLSINSEIEWIILPTNARYKQKSIEKLISSVCYGKSSYSSFPMTDSQGYIRAIAIPFNSQENSGEIEIIDDRFFSKDIPTLMCQDINNWNSTDNQWVSTVPYIGNQDPNVVVWEIEKMGFSVSKIESEPFHMCQGSIIDAPKISAPYKAWYLEISGAYSGVLQLGHFKKSGYGVFSPKSLYKRSE